MTTRKTETQLRRAELVKVARAILTVQHRTKLDRELNDVLPDLEEEFDRRIQAGELPGSINLGSIVRKALPDAS
jgi:hypothetical protein